MILTQTGLGERQLLLGCHPGWGGGGGGGGEGRGLDYLMHLPLVFNHDDKIEGVVLNRVSKYSKGFFSLFIDK